MTTTSRLGGSLLAALLVLMPPIAELLGLGHSLTLLLVAATGLMGVAVVAIAAEPRWKRLVLITGLSGVAFASLHFVYGNPAQ